MTAFHILTVALCFAVALLFLCYGVLLNVVDELRETVAMLFMGKNRQEQDSMINEEAVNG